MVLLFALSASEKTAHVGTVWAHILPLASSRQFLEQDAHNLKEAAAPADSFR